ncbi:MAG: protein kinase domain-containing protein, partial [Gemmataceae bacterium]
MAQILTCPDDPLLQRFVLGKTTDQEAAEMEQHLVSCPRCVHTLHELKASDTVIEALRARKDIPMEKDDAALKAQMKRLIEMPSAVNEPTIDATSSATPTGPAFDCLSPPLQEGEIGRLAHYRVLKVLGEGGMGTVFQAEDTHLDRLVALKVMKPEVAKNPSAKQRFTREAKTCATLKHDHIVTIYQVGEERGVPFLAMEFLEGLPLDRLLEGNKKLSIAQILRIGKEMAKGLSAAHEKGLIHRDIKPGNIWLDKSNGRVRILDFGLARAAASDDVHLTQSGVIVGTPAYMAPEQARAEEVDARADLFSLGVVLYRLCAGVLPFKGKDTMSMLMALAMDMPRPVREINAAIPAEVADLIMKLLAKNAQDRPQSAKEVVQIIQTIERNLSNASQAALKAPVAPVVPPAAALPAANPFQDLTEARPPVVVPPKSVPRKKPAEKSTPPQASGGRQTPAKMKDQGANAPRSPNRRYLFIGLGALLLPALLLGGWVIIRDKDGNEVAKVKIPDGGQAVVVPGTTPTTTTPAQPPLPVGVRPLPAGPSPFDALKRADISELELANAGDGDPAKAPADLVAVVGDSRFQNWGGANGGLFHRDGQRFFATTNERLFVWDQATGRLLLSRPMSGRIDAFSPDGKRLVSGSDDQTLKVWDAASGQETLTLKGHTRFVNSVAFSPDG